MPCHPYLAQAQQDLQHSCIVGQQGTILQMAFHNEPSCRETARKVGGTSQPVALVVAQTLCLIAATSRS